MEIRSLPREGVCDFVIFIDHHLEESLRLRALRVMASYCGLTLIVVSV